MEILFSSLIQQYVYMEKNRTPLAVVLGCLVWPCIFIPGTKAQMPQGYEVEAMVASNTEYIF